MKDFFDRDAYNSEDIQNLITIKAEESVNLDFKAADSLGSSDGKKNEIAKDVSSFANSDGGIIIYGILEKDFKADSIDFVNGHDFSKEWLEQVINSRIQKRISGISIFPVRFDGDLTKTVFIVKIPQSNAAPHLSSDKRFYKRFNFQSIAMEEYEIRDLFNRKQKTQIELSDILFVQGMSSSAGKQIRFVEYLLRFQACNIGNTIEEMFKLEVHIPKELILVDASNDLREYKIRDENGISVFSIPNSSPIYQGEITTIVNGKIRVSERVLHLLENPGVRAKIYFSSGTLEKAYDLLNVLTYGPSTPNSSNLLKDQQWIRD